MLYLRYVIVMFFAMSSTLVHAAGLPMMYEIKPQEQANKILANLIEESLNSDPRGEAVIRGSKCTTPNHFFEAIREYHPGAILGEIGELPSYIESLQLRPAPPTEFQMTRILHKVNQGNDECTLDVKGWKRTINNGELAWFDSNLGELVLAGNCSNIIGPPTSDKALVSSSSFSGKPYTLRVRPWLWEKFTSKMQKRILEVNKNESNDSYGKKDGSVSRDLGSEFVKLWRKNKASTITVSMDAWVYYPGYNDLVSANPGDHPRHPDLVYWETTVPRDLVGNDMAEFWVLPKAPKGCTVVYPRAGSWLGTRPAELSKSVKRGGSGINLNVIISCPVRV